MWVARKNFARAEIHGCPKHALSQKTKYNRPMGNTSFWILNVVCTADAIFTDEDGWRAPKVIALTLCENGRTTPKCPYGKQKTSIPYDWNAKYITKNFRRGERLQIPKSEIRNLEGSFLGRWNVTYWESHAAGRERPTFAPDKEARTKNPPRTQKFRKYRAGTCPFYSKFPR